MYGDVKKFLLPGGVSSIMLRDGDAVRDNGIHNMLLYSLFSVDWPAGNVFANRDSQKLHSRFVRLHNESITADNLFDIEDSVRESLKWMKDANIIGRVSVDTRVLSTGVRETKIVVEYPGTGGIEAFRVSKFTNNWEFMRDA